MNILVLLKDKSAADKTLLFVQALNMVDFFCFTFMNYSCKVKTKWK